MAFGTWAEQNKIRNGVYIKYDFEQPSNIRYASEGALAFNTQLPLNPGKLLKVTSSDFRNNVLVQYGVVQGTDVFRFIQSLFAHCNTLYIYSAPVTGGVQASLTGSGYVATAKFPGVAGSGISIEVMSSTAPWTVNTYFNNALVATQTVASDFTVTGANAFVNLVVDDTLEAQIPTVLEGGVDGTINISAAQESFFNSLLTTDIEIIAIDTDNGVDLAMAIDFVEAYNAEHIQKIQVVTAKDDSLLPNSQYVIQVAPTTGIDLRGSERTTGQVVILVGAYQAAATFKDDLTFTQISELAAVELFTNAEYEDFINNGVLALSLRSDRAVVIEDDINSLVLLDTAQSDALRSNDTIRLLNDLSFRITAFGENIVLGKRKVVQSTFDAIKAFVVGIMNEYQNDAVIVNFDANTDVIVGPGEQPGGILCNIAIQKTTAAKKLYFAISVN